MHPQTGESITDEICGRLVRTCKWSKKGTSPMHWWGVECMIHRWSNDCKEIASPTQFISLTPNETLCLLTYITTPYTTPGTTNCLMSEWADLLNDVINNCLKPKTYSDTTTFKTQLSKEDDCTIYLHNTENMEDGVPPEMVLADFGKLVKAAMNKNKPPQLTPPPKMKMIEAAPSHGQPPNAPIRKNNKRTVIATRDSDDDDDDNLPLASAYPKQQKKKRPRQKIHSCNE